MWLLDRSGASAGQPRVKAVLRRQDRFGQLVAEKRLVHDAYRTGSRATGSIAIMDSSGVLHIYDATLNLVLKTNLREDPRAAGASASASLKPGYSWLYQSSKSSILSIPSRPEYSWTSVARRSNS